MNPLVYQIVIGKTTHWLDKCISSVKSYAEKHGYDYEVDTKIPEKYSHFDSRMASEWMRLDKLSSRPYVLYVDWDIELRKDFELKDSILTIKVIDALVYFGKNVDVAEKILQRAKEKYLDCPINGFGFYAFKEVVGEKYLDYLIEDSYYKHLMWSITGGTFYV